MILHWAIDLRCQELPEVSRNKSTACAEACPTRLWALAGGQRRGFAFHTAVGRSKDHQSTWWAAWSSVHRSGGHTEPGQASSGPGDTADICIYSPWALTAHWGGTLVKWWNSPRIFEPFFSINPVGDPAKSHRNIRGVNVTDLTMFNVIESLHTSLMLWDTEEASRTRCETDCWSISTTGHL